MVRRRLVAILAGAALVVALAVVAGTTFGPAVKAGPTLSSKEFSNGNQTRLYRPVGH